ncbi:hypothetical protein LRY65_05290 [Candidatus Woesebacteria bacterium]|nr:hypothetical protein [Candidatus Woesebacteria bacterium]MCD8507336.1 hypothetical protein [Candidatus Woesebacteria bacterium]MCD8527583.1 hypothetical protein [Candidatus Woesebacteria bacterium]MCD8546445.1 hypothetical protein [Candidatus Woesebacteria bacterium]
MPKENSDPLVAIQNLTARAEQNREGFNAIQGPVSRILDGALEEVRTKTSSLITARDMRERYPQKSADIAATITKRATDSRSIIEGIQQSVTLILRNSESYKANNLRQATENTPSLEAQKLEAINNEFDRILADLVLALQNYQRIIEEEKIEFPVDTEEKE